MLYLVVFVQLTHVTEASCDLFSLNLKYCLAGTASFP